MSKENLRGYIATGIEPYLNTVESIRGSGARSAVAAHLFAFGEHAFEEPMKRDKAVSMDLALSVIAGNYTLVHTVGGSMPAFRGKDNRFQLMFNDKEVMGVLYEAIDRMHGDFDGAPQSSDSKANLISHMRDQGNRTRRALAKFHGAHLLKFWQPNQEELVPALWVFSPEEYESYLADYQRLVEQYGVPKEYDERFDTSDWRTMRWLQDDGFRSKSLYDRG